MGSFDLACYDECEGIGGYCEDAVDTSSVLGKRGGLAIHTLFCDARTSGRTP